MWFKITLNLLNFLVKLVLFWDLFSLLESPFPEALVEVVFAIVLPPAVAILNSSLYFL